MDKASCLPSSPAHKRRKVFGLQVVANVSQDASIGVREQPLPHNAKGPEKDASARRMRQIEEALRDVDTVGPLTSLSHGENKNPSGPKLTSGPSPLAPPSGFSTAFTLASALSFNREIPPPSPSPEIPSEQDYSSWFNSDAKPTSDLLAPTLFQTAKSMALAEAPESMSAFKACSGRRLVMPSEAALNAARERMKAWQEEEINPVSISSSPSLGPTDSSFDFADGSSQLLQSPSPATFSKATGLEALMPRLSKDFDSPCGSLKRKPKPFRSPLLPIQPNLLGVPAQGYASSPLNPRHSASVTFAMTTPVFSPVRPSSFKARGAAGGPGKAKAKFVTPFLPGMRPGEAGRVALEKRKEVVNALQPIQKLRTLKMAKAEVANLVNVGTGESKDDLPAINKGISPERKTLKSSGLAPQAYTPQQMEELGINATELSQISPDLALYYSFHTRNSSLTDSGSEEQEILGPPAALSELHKLGCPLATKAWVDNHWALILWKLAGMVALDPDRETSTDKRWCWGEAIRQLLYRYHRELHAAKRPALRLITTQDAPASLPLVLCVSNITWPEKSGESSQINDSRPELELTDGWYRLRAEIDAPLIRAVRKGTIRVGRKLGIVGARLSTERKDPLDILEAYNSTKLIITGNSSHLAPWHAKLGFQRGYPPVSTMSKLTPDGGLIGVMDLTVLKVHPIGFFEFIEENDVTRKKGPWNEKEEARISARWMAKRESEITKMRTERDKKIRRMETLAERLERKAGNFKPADDDQVPDQIENLYDELEDTMDVGPVFSRLDANGAGWLARCIREGMVKDKDKIGDEIERELEHVCPPRQVRSFRILVIRDARTCKRPSHRQAQMTVWDALALTRAEDAEGDSFRVNQRFRVTNLVPTHHKSWMGQGEGAEIFLATRKDSKWIKIQ